MWQSIVARPYQEYILDCDYTFSMHTGRNFGASSKYFLKRREFRVIVIVSRPLPFGAGTSEGIGWKLLLLLLHFDLLSP